MSCVCHDEDELDHEDLMKCAAGLIIMELCYTALGTEKIFFNLHLFEPHAMQQTNKQVPT